jgi:hypothetical protein
MTLRNMQLKPLGNARKRYAIFVIAVGLSTFFLPMVIHSPVLGRTQWRPLDIAHSVFQGSLPVAKGQF